LEKLLVPNPLYPGHATPSVQYGLTVVFDTCTSTSYSLDCTSTLALG
jgi:hypothetical protein